jgi:hypothetical protein
LSIDIKRCSLVLFRFDSHDAALAAARHQIQTQVQDDSIQDRSYSEGRQTDRRDRERGTDRENNRENDRERGRENDRERGRDGILSRVETLPEAGSLLNRHDQGMG